MLDGLFKDAPPNKEVIKAGIIIYKSKIEEAIKDMTSGLDTILDDPETTDAEKATVRKVEDSGTAFLTDLTGFFDLIIKKIDSADQEEIEAGLNTLRE